MLARPSQPMSGSNVHHSCSHFQAGIWPQSQTNCKEVRKYSLAGCHGRRRKSNRHLNLRIPKYRTTNVPPKKKKTPFFSGVFPITLSDNSIIPVAQAKHSIILFLSHPTFSPSRHLLSLQNYTENQVTSCLFCHFYPNLNFSHP